MNNKAIQILRGSKNYDPKNISSELLDGQPFYSKNNRQLYIGDNTKDCTSPVGAANLMPGYGLNSIIQILEYDDKGFDPNPLAENDYIGNNYAIGTNDIALGRCNYTHSQKKDDLDSPGQGAIILGGTRNQNYGEKSVILGGEYNINTSYGGFQAGYRNITGNFTISDSNWTKKAQGTDNTNNYAGDFNIQLGTNNNIKSAEKTIQIGHGLINDKNEDVIQLGTTSNRKVNALLEIGYGEDLYEIKHNALVIYKSGDNTLSNRCIQINGDTGIGFQPGQLVAYNGKIESFNKDRLPYDDKYSRYRLAPRNTVSIGDNYIYSSVDSLYFGSLCRDFAYEYKKDPVTGEYEKDSSGNKIGYPTYPTYKISNVISIGKGNYMNNNNQVAIGHSLNLNGENQIVLGNLNVSNPHKFFVIANGNVLNDPNNPDDAPKANIFTLDDNGNAEFGVCKDYYYTGQPKDFTIGTVTANLKANRIDILNWDNIINSAQTSLQDNIDTLQNAINTEAATREVADTQLQTNIDNEASARTAADTQLQKNIDNERIRATGVESNLQTQINVNRENIAEETSRATGEENKIKNKFKFNGQILWDSIYSVNFIY